MAVAQFRPRTVRCIFCSRRWLETIVQLGGNDLCLTYCEPLELASKIKDLAQWLLKNGLAKVLYVCELFTRPHPRGVSSETYETRRSAVNRYLDTLLENA